MKNVVIDLYNFEQDSLKKKKKKENILHGSFLFCYFHNVLSSLVYIIIYCTLSLHIESNDYDTQRLGSTEESSALPASILDPSGVCSGTGSEIKFF